MTGVSLALWLLENWHGLPRFPGPCHRLRADFSHSAPDRSDRYQRMVGTRSFLPFGPLFFRLNYPEQARDSYLFRIGTLLCIFGFVVMRPGWSLSTHNGHRTTSFPQRPNQPVGYAMEKPAPPKKTSPAVAVPTLTLDERRATNAKELERLQGMEEQLKLRRRDLLHSDTEGNRLYAIDLASYNDALAKATTEKNALASAK